MSNTEEQSIALTNRSLRTIRTELEFLVDSKVITPAQLTSIQNILPAQALLSPSVQQTATSQQAPTPSLGKNPTSTYNSPPAPVASPTIPPPAYAHVPAPRTLASASALYEYLPSDDGDLALLPNDRISITEFMNADWAKGRNERTGQEGIFPRSYVSIIDEKSAMVQQPPPPPSSSHYGNLPLDVSQSGSSGGGVESKFNQQGKKFGKKMGNAAIFGAGATIGSNMVNKIF